MTDAPLPCPKCRRRDEVIVVEYVAEERWFVRCGWCHITSKHVEGRLAAIADWNNELPERNVTDDAAAAHPA